MQFRTLFSASSCSSGRARFQLRWGWGHVHAAPSIEMAQTSPPSSAGRGCRFRRGWLWKANAAPALGMRKGHKRLLLLVGMPGTIPQYPRLCVAWLQALRTVLGVEWGVLVRTPKFWWAKTPSSPNLLLWFLAPSESRNSRLFFQGFYSS